MIRLFLTSNLFPSCCVRLLSTVTFHIQEILKLNLLFQSKFHGSACPPEYLRFPLDHLAVVQLFSP